MDHFIIGLLADLMNVLERNLALLVDDKQSPLRDAIGRPIGAKGFGYSTLWLKIGQERIGDTTKALRPGDVAGNGIDRNTQNLGICVRETVQIRFIGRHLDRSDRGPVEWVKGDEHVLASPEVGELDGSAKVALQFEIRSHLTYFNAHKFSWL